MLSRRSFQRLLAQSALSLPLGRVLGAAGQRPNLIIILADDLGYGDLGCYGHPTIRTPHLDRMAAEGVRFTQFYAAAAVCSPSRAALLAGRLPIRTGVNQVLSPWSTGGIQKQEITIAEALRPTGYATACIGKWHLGHLPQYLPTRHGFDRYFGIPYSNDMSRATAGNPQFIKQLNQHPEVPGTPLMRDEKVVETEPDQRRLTARYTEEAIRFLRDSVRSGKPFFLYLPHTFPHVPLFASERFRGKSARGLYGDVVEELDWSVGEIRRTLAELGVEKNTLVTFTSDNGPWLIKKQEGGSAGLLREGKGSTWEGGMREPFIACWPGRIPPGVVTQSFGTTMDLFPTCLKLAGVEMPRDREFDGVDLSPVLLENKPGREAFLFYYLGANLRAVRHGPWKLHLASNSPATGDGVTRYDRPPLYNLLEDPSEKYDLSDSHPDVVRDLLQLIEEHKRTLKPGPPQV
ncbi:MAG: sulfatase [Acidobacteria bacterium]|nr:sulfatase [Acidobacteriota bacterium]